MAPHASLPHRPPLLDALLTPNSHPLLLTTFYRIACCACAINCCFRSHSFWLSDT